MRQDAKSAKPLHPWRLGWISNGSPDGKQITFVTWEKIEGTDPPQFVLMQEKPDGIVSQAVTVRDASGATQVQVVRAQN